MKASGEDAAVSPDAFVESWASCCKRAGASSSVACCLLTVVPVPVAAVAAASGTAGTAAFCDLLISFTRLFKASNPFRISASVLL